MVQEIKESQIGEQIERLVIAGDVSATNILMAIVALSKDGEKRVIKKKAYEGQKITDFNSQILEDLLNDAGLSREDIESLVLSPAGPIIDQGRYCKITNAQFEIDASKTGIQTALINDFKAIGYAVASLGMKGGIKTVQLRHLGGSYGKGVKGGRIGIHGAGTGLGTVRLHYDVSNDLYVPLDSEGGHKFLAADPSDQTDVELIRWLATYEDGNLPVLESVLSGRGIVHICAYFLSKLDNEERERISKELEGAEDKAAFIAKKAKEDRESVFGKTMKYFWMHYGMALHDLALHENATGGIWVAGGILRKNILDKGGEIDPYVEQLIMDYFEKSRTHAHILREIPVYVIMDPEIGLRGAIEVAANRRYMEREMYRSI